MDDKNNTFLRISNGAKFSIPLGETKFSEQSHTFEIMFKIKNVQNYEGLVKNVTRYWVNEKEKITDEILYDEFTK
jgi:putative IMPACT (imprinted ancient) family translation regulator